MTYRGWLVPAVLLCLRRDGGARGPGVAGDLAELGFGEVRPDELDPVLRDLERAGLVASEGTGERRHGLTASGEASLWSGPAVLETGSRSSPRPP